MATNVSRIGFLRENPEATYEEFFNATGGSRQSYHSNRWITGKEVKGAVKTRKSKTVRVKAHGRHPAGTAPADLIIANNKVVKLQSEIDNLKHQIVGFRAVISYLENLAGLRHSQ